MWRKNIRKRKLQTLVMTIIVMLCAILITTSFSILTSLNEPYERLAEECDSPSGLIYGYDSSEKAISSLKEQLQQLPQMNEVLRIKKHYVEEDMLVNQKKIECFTAIKEYNDRIFGKVHYLKGDRETTLTLKKNECIIPACIANEYDIQLGDEITFKHVNGDLSYRVIGIFTDPFDSSLAFDSSVIIKEIPNELYTDYQIYYYSEKDYTGAEIKEMYFQKYATQFPGELSTVSGKIEDALISSKLVGAILLVIGLIMLVISCFIIYFIIRSVMISDAKKIAIYKTLGYREHDIRQMYVIFYFVLASVATIVGIICSRFLARSILSDMYEDIGAEFDHFDVGIGIGCYVVIVGLIVLTVLWVVRKNIKVKPIYALNGMAPTNTKKRKEGNRSYQGSFSPFGIAIRMMLSNKKGLVGIVLIAVCSIIGINFGVISLDVARGMKDNNTYWLGVDRSDIMITISKGTNTEDVLKKLENTKEIEKSIPCSFGSGVISLDWKEGMDSSVMYPFAYDDYSNVDLPVLRGRNPKRGDEIAISGRIAADTDKEIGDYLDVCIDGEKRSYLITGMYQTYYNMGHSCRVTMDTFKETKRENSYDTVSIYLKEDADVHTVLEMIEKNIGAYGKVQLRQDLFASIMELITAPQESAIPPIVLLVLFIGGANIFCIVMLKNAKEERTNGIYKCIGYSSFHLLKANLIYIMLLALVSLVVALPLTLLCYPKIMTVALSTFGLLEYEVDYNVMHLAFCNSAVFVIFLVSTILSSKSIWKVNVRDLVLE